MYEYYQNPRNKSKSYSAFLTPGKMWSEMSELKKPEKIPFINAGYLLIVASILQLLSLGEVQVVSTAPAPAPTLHFRASRKSTKRLIFGK